MNFVLMDICIYESQMAVRACHEKPTWPSAVLVLVEKAGTMTHTNMATQ
jgi:hypothetical protein